MSYLISKYSPLILQVCF